VALSVADQKKEAGMAKTLKDGFKSGVKDMVSNELNQFS